MNKPGMARILPRNCEPFPQTRKGKAMESTMHFRNPGTFKSLCGLGYNWPSTIPLTSLENETTCVPCKEKLVHAYPQQRISDEDGTMNVIVVNNPEDLFNALKMMLVNEEELMHKMIGKCIEMAAAIKTKAQQNENMTPLDVYKKIVWANRNTPFDNSDYELLFAAAIYAIAFEVEVE